MDKDDLANQRNSSEADKITQLEKELEDLKRSAQEQYQHKLTQSPLREKTIGSLSTVSAKRLDHPEALKTQLKSTYSEEEHLNQVTKLANRTQQKQTILDTKLVTRKRATNTVFWAGIVLFLVSLVLVASSLLIKILG